MPLIDPLLKSVKYLVQEFHSVDEEVNDKSIYLEQFCVTLEQCFLKGMKRGQWDITKVSNHSARRKRMWCLLRSFETEGPMPFAVSSAIIGALADNRIKTADGRVRYMVRHCLAHRSLHVLLEFLVSKRQQLRECYYESQSGGKAAMQTMAEFGGGDAIIIHEELAEQFRSLLLTCSTSLNFDLSLTNTYFLDETWQIPMTLTMELVPTHELGIEMVYINGYAIVTRLKPGSVASEALGLGVGDLLVEMNDKVLFPATMGGDNDTIAVWRHCRRKGLPCALTVIKPRSPVTGSIYTPLKETLTEYHDWMEVYYERRQKKLEKKNEQAEKKEAKLFQPSLMDDRTPVLDPGASGTFSVRYIGEVSTGQYGGIDQIESVIKQVQRKQMEKTTFDVTLRLTEIAVETQASDNRLFRHKYADIASCGKMISDKLHFCYIAGDTFCTISKQFKGYVFEAKTLSQAKIILNGIYQGFKRTTWFM